MFYHVMFAEFSAHSLTFLGQRKRDIGVAGPIGKYSDRTERSGQILTSTANLNAIFADLAAGSTGKS
ncbi:MAG TPA: hypothetical protein VHZ74_00565 [Bryobacteraceae bacterium]|jgi:hypothetical protein|nr:hypothetical protein [Bryobacteraceae bacterium]